MSLRDDVSQPSSDTESPFPEPVVATPSLVQGTPDEPINWWQPSWRDGLQHLGYRWIFFIPIALAIGLLIWLTAFRSIYDILLFLGVKLLIVFAAIVFALGAFGVRQAARARKEPFCIFCGYNLSNLPDNYRCPECGRNYTWALIAEYRRDPKWFIERWKAQHELPPSQIAIAAGAFKRKRRAQDGTE